MPASCRSCPFPFLRCSVGICRDVPVDSKWLLPFLQTLTAQASELMLRLLGVPVFREGTLLSLPVADFEVAEACSGYRFMIAMTVIILAIAWVYYASIAKRVVFMLAALVTTIMINIARVVGIMILARSAWYSCWRLS